MDKHIRFHIDLAPSDAKLLDRLALRISNRNGTPISRPDVVRIALRHLAKKEKMA
jgi:hypothetical protein